MQPNEKVPLDTAGPGRRLAFEPEPHTNFIFTVVGPNGQDITAAFLVVVGLLAVTGALGLFLWRRHSSK